MTSWFLRGLRRGVLTTRYPAGPPDPWSATLPTPPSFPSDVLTAEQADEMVRRCPSSALKREGEEIVFDVGACTACGRCREVAPHAMTASGEFELAATDRGQLVKRIALRKDAS